jgi:hypothetical protein
MKYQKIAIWRAFLPKTNLFFFFVTEGFSTRRGHAGPTYLVRTKKKISRRSSAVGAPAGPPPVALQPDPRTRSEGHHAGSFSQPLLFSLDSLPSPPYADLGAAPQAVLLSPPSSSSNPHPPLPPLRLLPKTGGHRYCRSESRPPVHPQRVSDLWRLRAGHHRGGGV